MQSISGLKAVHRDAIDGNYWPFSHLHAHDAATGSKKTATNDGKYENGICLESTVRRSRRHTVDESALSVMNGVRDLEHLSRLDLVWIAELIAIRVEDLHVRVRVPQMLFRNFAQRVTRLNGVRLAAAGGRSS